MDLVSDIYEVAKILPAQENYALRGQIQRASVSIPSNIAEGSRRSSRIDFRQFCTIAMGSAAELETQIILIKNLYPDVEVTEVLEKIGEVQKMLGSLIRKLQKIPTN